MSRQIATSHGTGYLPGLADQVAILERRVTTLNEALNTLIDGLIIRPVDEPDDERIAKAARRAHDLLARGRQPGQE